MTRSPVSEEQVPFLRAILAAPDDDAPALIHADWLEENGQPERAEFIRLQIERSRLEETDPAFVALRRREFELLRVWEKEWRREARPFDTASRPFERGYLRSGSFSHLDRFRRQAVELIDRVPLQRVRIGGFDQSAHGLETLANHPATPGLTTLALRSRRFLARQMQAFPRCSPERFRSLRVLDLGGHNRIGSSGVEALAGSDCVRGVVTLNLGGNDLAEAGLRALTASSCLTQLRALGLRGLFLTTAEVDALDRRGRFGELTRLEVSLCSDDPFAIARLVQGELIRRLERLDLVAHWYPDRLFDELELVPPECLRSLRWLGLEGVLSVEQIQRLGRAESLEGIRTLRLNRNALNDEGLVALADAPLLERIEHLDLTFNSFGSPGVRALIESPRLGRLKSLRIAQRTTRPIIDALETLIRSPLKNQLRLLEVAYSETNAGVLRRLANDSTMILRLRPINQFGLPATAGLGWEEPWRIELDPPLDRGDTWDHAPSLDPSPFAEPPEFSLASGGGPLRLDARAAAGFAEALRFHSARCFSSGTFAPVVVASSPDL
ncbi:repeat-companion domain protein [Isosphaera pallida ATCC 43644]|uniref:Repeat-companion domain protein n=2 Tax=Isosphaera pallida TaxID=128 RepID=E8QY07_ISOPI|nr:repeat-companion domain protein [Isosphaera pallida ATCC 43644]